LGRYKTYIAYLDIEKQRGTKWSDLPNKENDVCVLLLNIFKGELESDFYKVIEIDSKRITQIQSYNLRGTLNKQGNSRKRSIELPMSTLPTSIVILEYKPSSKNTLELYLGGG
jgi:type-2 restriction enzyme haeIII